MEHNFMGIGFNEVTPHTGLFEKEYDDFGEECILVSTKTYKHEERDFSFDYKYVISVLWCEGKCYAELYLMPTIGSMDKKYLEGAVECSGVEDAEYLDASDILFYGGGAVQIACEEIDVIDEDELDKVYDKIASIVPCIDTIRGFYLDKPWNAVGTTGWDTLRHCIKGEPLF